MKPSYTKDELIAEFGPDALSRKNKVKPRPTGNRRKMNKTEERYQEHLELLRVGGVIKSHLYESIGLRLADKTFYYPDFLVITDCVEYHELKGHWEDDARVKIKVAAERYPWFLFKAIKANGENWEEEYF